MGPYPLSAMPYDLGFTLLALALFRYAGVLGLLIRMLKKPRVDSLLVLGGILLLVSVAIHFYASAFVLPALGHADAAAFDRLFSQAMLLRNISLGCLVLSGALSALTGWLYYQWISR